MHTLDNPIWHALSTVHASFAEGDELAKRYPIDVAPLAAMKEQTPSAYASLGQLLEKQDMAVLFLDAPPCPPQGWKFIRNFLMEQMVCTGLPDAPTTANEIQALRKEDVPQMLELAELTEPGPFRKRTIELGGYKGIRDANRLVAMTGQRVSVPGFTEVSAVCTHPDYRGRGYGNALVAAVAHAIFARGETPFLEVKQDNATALRLYERLGFRIRRTLHLAVLMRPE